MIKEWCKHCFGHGYSHREQKQGGDGSFYDDYIKCKSCQGKGWVALEPKWNGPANLFRCSEEDSVIQDSIFATFKPIEVYIKESK